VSVRQYAETAERYWKTYLPSQVATIKPEQRPEFFASLAKQVADAGRILGRGQPARGKPAGRQPADEGPAGGDGSATRGAGSPRRTGVPAEGAGDEGSRDAEQAGTRSDVGRVAPLRFQPAGSG
jgi:hypothetical protein